MPVHPLYTVPYPYSKPLPGTSAGKQQKTFLRETALIIFKTGNGTHQLANSQILAL